MMKAIKTLILFCVVLFLTSCQDTDYTKAIPQNSTMVSRVDFNSIFREADYSKSTLNGALSLYLGIAVGGQDAKELKSYIREPEKFGIDLRKPAYIFHADKVLGVTLDLHDHENLAELLSILQKHHIVSKPRKSDKVTTCNILGEILLAYDKSSMLMLANTDDGGMSHLNQLAIQLLNQEKEQSFASTEQFERLNDDGENKNITLYLNMASLKDGRFKDIADSFLPDNVRPADVNMFSVIDFTDGLATINTEVSGRTEKAQAALEEANKSFHNIRCAYTDIATDDMGIWATFGVKGDWILERLKSNKDTKMLLTALGRAIDIDQMLRAVDGDFTVTLPADFEDKLVNHPEFFIIGDLDNTKFMTDVEYWQKSMVEYGAKMKKTGKNAYQLSYDKYMIDWGIDNKSLYIGSHNQTVRNALSQHNGMLKPLEPEISEHQIYVYCNMQKMPLHFLRSIPLFGGKIHHIQSLTVKSKSVSDITIQIELKDKSTNFLKQMM